MELDLNKYKMKLAIFLAKKDAYEHKIVDEEGNYRSWAQVPEMGHEEYLKDAATILQTFIILGWAPSKFVEHQMLGALHTTIRRDPNMPPALKRSLTKWFKDLKLQVEREYADLERQLNDQ